MPTAAYIQRQQLIDRFPIEERLHSYRFFGGGSWRWQRARDLARGDYPPDPALDCSIVERAAEFLRRWRAAGKQRDGARAEFPELLEAWRLGRAPLLKLLGVQARLLSLQSSAEISSKTGIPAAVVDAYSRLFYSFEHAYPQADGWIRNVLIRVDYLPGLCTTLRSLTLLLSYYGGPVIADDILATLSHVPAPLNVGQLVRGDGPYTEHNWRVLRALASQLIPWTDKNAIRSMREYARVRAARRPDVGDTALASTLMALEWKEQLNYARLAKPHLDAQLRTLQQPLAA